jgi:hypothetical protein
MDLWTTKEFRSMLEGRALTAAGLYEHATYDHPISCMDYHVQYFWISLYELSVDQLHTLLTALCSKKGLSVDTVNTLPCMDRSSVSDMSLKLHVMKPTAAALLLADSTEISLFPELNGISIPKYSSLRIMQTQLRYLIKSLEK